MEVLWKILRNRVKKSVYTQPPSDPLETPSLSFPLTFRDADLEVQVPLLQVVQSDFL